MSKKYIVTKDTLIVMGYMQSTDDPMLEVNCFYERYPYPQLPIRERTDLLEKMHANVMRRILSTAGLEAGDLKGKSVLDAGCGTGEKACYFSHHGASVTAFDLCGSSLGKARLLAEKFGLVVDFKRQDILEFSPEERYDHVFSLGVLHHTPEPEKGFGNIASACKSGGTVTIGLYNRYGRFFHRARRLWIGLLCGRNVGKRMEFVKKSVLKRGFKSAHEEAFTADKYANPYESYHTVGEVLGWFEQYGLEFVGAYPAVGRSALLSQLRWLARSQGFFVMSGRKI